MLLGAPGLATRNKKLLGAPPRQLPKLHGTADIYAALPRDMPSVSIGEWGRVGRVSRVG